MSGILHTYIPKRAIDSNGIADGSSAAFYTTGTLTPATIYADAALTTARANPVVVPSGAEFPAFYLDPAVTYRRIITYSDGSTDDEDPWEGLSISGIGLATGGTLVDIIKWITPEQFGDVDTPATCHTTLQACFDYAAANGYGVLLGDRIYTTRYPLYLLSNLTVQGSGALSEIYNEIALVDAANLTACAAIIGGQGHPAYKASNTKGSSAKVVYFTHRAAQGLTKGARTVTLASGLGSNFSVGDIVHVRTRAYVRGSGLSELPHFGYDAVVLSKATDTLTLNQVNKKTVPFTSGLTVSGAVDNGSGLVRLTITGHSLTATSEEHPITVSSVGGTTEANGTHAWTYIDGNTIDLKGTTFANAYTSGGTAEWAGTYVFNYSTTDVVGLLGDAGRFVRPRLNVRLTGFKVGSAEGSSFIRMGCIDSTIDVEVTKSTAMCGMNAMTNCDITIKGRCTDDILELASNSYNSRWNIKGEVDATGTSYTGALVKPSGENSSFNTINLWMSGNYASAAGGLFLPNGGSNNTVHVHAANLPNITGAFISYTAVAEDGATDSGETQNYNADNTIVMHCDAQLGSSIGRFIRLEAAAGDAYLLRPTIIGGKFFGTPATASVVTGGTDALVDTWFEGGSINTAAGVGAKLVIDGGATLANYDYTNVASFVYRGVEQHSGGYAETVSATTYQFDFANGPTQHITATGASIELSTILNSSVGAKGKLTLTNGAGGARTATAHANWKLGGFFWPVLADGESVTVEFTRIPDASGISYAVTSMTMPGDGAAIAPTRAAAPTVTYSLTYAAPSVTYAAPSGGGTQDTECRASLAQAAVDLTAARASLAQLAADAAELAVDIADLRTKLAAAGVTA